MRAAGPPPLRAVCVLPPCRRHGAGCSAAHDQRGHLRDVSGHSQPPGSQQGSQHTPTLGPASVPRPSLPPTSAQALVLQQRHRALPPFVCSSRGWAAWAALAEEGGERLTASPEATENPIISGLLLAPQGRM